jgi:hypothetical protein
MSIVTIQHQGPPECASSSRVLPDARDAGYNVLITRDRAQFSDPRECDAIKKPGLHHIRYAQRQGARGLALALGAIIAAMPMVMEELEIATGGQRNQPGTGPGGAMNFAIAGPKPLVWYV